MTETSVLAIITTVLAGLAHLVERHLAKVEVASSSLVARSRVNQDIRFGCPDFFVRRKELDTDTHARSAHKSSGGWQEFTTFRSHKEIKHNHNTPHPFREETGGGCA